MNCRAALFLDRDDTLIADSGYLRDPTEVRLLPGVRAALQAACRCCRLFLFTNQSGIARGLLGWDDAEAVNRRMFELLGLPAGAFAATCIAAEGPDEPACYRKPSPRFILECIDHYALDPAQCWMAGDRESDLRAGVRAGIHSVLINPSQPLPQTLQAYVAARQIPVHASLGEFVRRRVRRETPPCPPVCAQRSTAPCQAARSSRCRGSPWVGRA